MKRYYEYSRVEGCQVGLMICEQCKQKITRGDFRYWLDEKLDGYRSEHRKCSAQDKRWDVIDAEREAVKSHHKKLEQACQSFYDQFGENGVEVLNSMFPS